MIKNVDTAATQNLCSTQLGLDKDTAVYPNYLTLKIERLHV